MNRLELEWQRLFGADGGRALVLELGRPADWPRTAALWRALQEDLGWPAPAIAVNGEDAYQLWCSLAEPLPAAEAAALAEALRRRCAADLAPRRWRAWPPGAPAAVPAEKAGSDGPRWSAFVTPDLAPLFAETPWLEIPPGDDAQAGLLAPVASVKPAQWAALPATTPPATPEPAAPAAPQLRPASGADPRAFLLGVMQDAAAPLALRVDAAKALLAAPSAVSAASPAWPTDGVAAPVQRQLDAYNAHDLERFVAEYHDDVQVFRPPAAEPVLAGKAAFAAHYAQNRFNVPTLHAALLNRIVVGSIVVDQEQITGLGETPLAAVAVYAVDGGRIRRVWFY